MNILPLRIEYRTPALIRVERSGPRGFEDRPSLLSVGRAEWKPDRVWILQRPTSLPMEGYRIDIVAREDGQLGVVICGPDGSRWFDDASPVPHKVHVPTPSDHFTAWALADRPRIIPPPWGVVPPPGDAEGQAQGDWEIDADARDIYIALRLDLSYRDWIAQLLRLTGPIPMLPLRALGLIDSRWHPYRQDELIAVWDRFDKEGIPLDIAAIDTDWRQGSSTGYAVNEELFPDIDLLFAEAHRRGLRTILNDHPEPVAEHATARAELRFRYEGLTSLLARGADYWWFDRNWPISLKEPAPGFSKEVWGMHVYTEIARRFRPDRRPLIMSNVDGVHNGIPEGPCSLISHRYPIWWTGDTRCWWDYLEHGVRNAVNLGLQALMPYVSEDLGGFWGTPDDELYARFVQYGALSPICRLHASYKQYRHPWLFGEAGAIAVDYIRLRYRLLPLLYSAAREAYRTGRPLLRRADEEWPDFPDARDPTQYLLSPDLLVAPILAPITPYAPIPVELLRTPEGAPGLRASYFANRECDGPPTVVEADVKLNHFWAKQSPHPGLEPLNYSIRWEGTLGPIPENGLYRIAIKGGMEVRLFVDGHLRLNAFGAPEKVLKFVDLPLRAGQSCSLRIDWRARGEWYEKCDFQLLWSRAEPTAARRDVWIPPGTWFDLWSGARVQGPRRISASATLRQMPIWIRAGGVIPSIPLRMRAGRAYWDNLTLDAFLPAPGSRTVRLLYEDEGEGWTHQTGVYRETRVELERTADRCLLTMSRLHTNAEAPAQQVRLRLHGLARVPQAVLLNGASCIHTFRPSADRWPDPLMLGKAGAPPRPVLLVDVGQTDRFALDVLLDPEEPAP
jgi:hypothetical protein